MSDDTSATEEVDKEVTPERLKDRINSGEDIFILDVRSENDYGEWRIDGETVETINYPYFDLLDGVPEDLHDALPNDRRITVLCAKGGASEMIAKTLQEEGYTVEHLERGMKGWARVYEYSEFDVEGDATIAQYRRPSSGCLAYLVVSNGEAAVVDPLRTFTNEYVQDAHALGADVTYAFDTHIHADHVSGVRNLVEEAEVTPVLPAAANARGVNYDVNYIAVEDGDVLEVGDIEIEAVHTPGHTTGMTTYRVGNVLFTGDGLFTESVARPDLEDPDATRDAAHTLHGSLRSLIERFDEDTIVAPAHFSDAATARPDETYTAELGSLVETMDALTMGENPFVDYVVDDMPPRPANHQSIIATNLGQESPSDEEAFELELGPNNCAASEESMTGD